MRGDIVSLIVQKARAINVFPHIFAIKFIAIFQLNIAPCSMFLVSV